MSKPVRLEINNAGSWKLLGCFDAADDGSVGDVLDASDELIRALHGDADSAASAARCPTMRIVIDDACRNKPLLKWNITDGWRDAETGDAV